MSSRVIQPSEIPFHDVPWGLTKVLVGQDESPGGDHSDLIEFKVTEYGPGYSHAGHVHPDQCEIIYVLEGEGVHEDTEGRRHTIAPGAMVWIPPDCWHANHNPHDVPLRVLVVKVPPSPSGG